MRLRPSAIPQLARRILHGKNPRRRSALSPACNHALAIRTRDHVASPIHLPQPEHRIRQAKIPAGTPRFRPHAIPRLRPSTIPQLGHRSVRAKSSQERRAFTRLRSHDLAHPPSCVGIPRPQSCGFAIRRPAASAQDPSGQKSPQARHAFARLRSRGLIHTPSRISSPRLRSCGFAHPSSRNLGAGSVRAKIPAGAPRFSPPAIARLGSAEASSVRTPRRNPQDDAPRAPRDAHERQLPRKSAAARTSSQYSQR